MLGAGGDKKGKALGAGSNNEVKAQAGGGKEKDKALGAGGDKEYEAPGGRRQ